MFAKQTKTNFFIAIYSIRTMRIKLLILRATNSNLRQPQHCILLVTHLHQLKLLGVAIPIG